MNSASGKEVQVKIGKDTGQVYRCHKCFNRDTPQSTFFEESGITDLLDSAINGYRSCAFAFGQTGAGKTFTVVGPSNSISPGLESDGLLGRSLMYVFSKLEALNTKFIVRLSCLEIYHEHVYDLFADERERTSLSVREHATDGFFLENCKLVACSNYTVACMDMHRALKARHVGGHDVNSRSNRSHCITDVFIELPGQRAKEGGFYGPDRVAVEADREYRVMGRMSLVDLAGSERLKSTNSTGKVLQEAGFINRSLYVLGKVIAGLVRTGGDLNHKDVPYRDSKLTKLLISSLGGNSRTMLVACVTEASGSATETLRTLKFSMSCARIKNRPVRFLDPQEKLILDLREEIKRLKMENKHLRSTIMTAPAGSLERGGGGEGGGGDGESDFDFSLTSTMMMQGSTMQSPGKRTGGGGGGGKVSTLRRTVSADDDISRRQRISDTNTNTKTANYGHGDGKKKKMSSASESTLNVRHTGNMNNNNNNNNSNKGNDDDNDDEEAQYLNDNEFDDDAEAEVEAGSDIHNGADKRISGNASSSHVYEENSVISSSSSVASGRSRRSQGSSKNMPSWQKIPPPKTRSH